MTRKRFGLDFICMASGTIDPAEVEKFSALAAEWWNPKGPFGALHRMNPVRLQYIRDLAAEHFSAEGLRPLAGLNALDLGCGGGLVSAPLARMGAKVTAIDASEEAIGAARAYAGQAGLDIDYRCMTAEALVEKGERFDLIAALEIVEHVADVKAFLAAASALVKPGGLLVLSTINRTAKARALAIVGAERILKWAPEGAHDYEKLVTPEEIRAGVPALTWRAPVGVTYQPLGSGWALTSDVSVNYLIAGAKPA
ncbi:MAG TPA: bifunctional 2-polyprenyl-6-hydroxyphenol methylase/3-demethylubiquinol 3-O-methyltransferase UbiG [Candidatus Binatia bacterium]|nr:bifunctional 2-polyprenyl-6-hydroxyphenol methylase/3-demethylubiquinol 3-O-methyltransferase UbiG [Candidatus Binatia bacterium]